MASSAGCALRSGNFLSSQARASVTRQMMICSCNTANAHAPVRPHVHPAARGSSMELLERRQVVCQRKPNTAGGCDSLSAPGSSPRRQDGQEGTRCPCREWHHDWSVGGVAQLPCVLVQHHMALTLEHARWGSLWEEEAAQHDRAVVACATAGRHISLRHLCGERLGRGWERDLGFDGSVVVGRYTLIGKARRVDDVGRCECGLDSLT